MTEKDAIIQLNFDMEMIRFNPDTGEIRTLEEIKARNEDNYKTYIADELAITALIEIQQYRAIGLTPQMVKDLIKSCKKHEKNALENAHIVDDYQSIGTVEEFKALKEKNTPMQLAEHNFQDEVHHYLCPSCRSIVCCSQNYCEECGQAFET